MMDAMLGGLRAAGEPTRLRLLALCARGELSVTELTRILGQSQPRVSRHLKLLVDAGLLERFREGSLVFYRIAQRRTPDAGLVEHSAVTLAHTLVGLLPAGDQQLELDLRRLDEIRQQRADAAERYFKENASRWKEIRALHVPEAEVEASLLSMAGSAPIDTLLDIGTGTGRMLELFARQVRHGVGIDNNQDMLAVARTTLEKPELSHLQVRKGDMFNMPVDSDSVDLATLHLVLHYCHEPAKVIGEAARTLRKNGSLIIVDFAAHQEEHLRGEHNHCRLGFSDDEIRQGLELADLSLVQVETLTGNPLTVKLWLGQERQQDDNQRHPPPR